MSLAIPTYKEHADALIAQLKALSAAQEKPLTFEKTKKATLLDCAQPTGVPFQGWTDYGYWHEGKLLPGRPW